MSTNLPVKQHAQLGASTAARWMACPGSVRMSRGIPNIETEYAREGTAAHALAEMCLREGLDPERFIGMGLEGVEVTQDMADFVGVFVRYCRALMVGKEVDLYAIEQKFDLSALNTPAAMFGTADFVVYDPATRELEVVDLKYGAGVVVEARGNKQLRYYGLGAALVMQRAGAVIETVKLTIVQPRVSHPDGIIRSETLPMLDLLDFSGELLDAARATLAPDAPLVAGSHCRFCPAAGVCPAQLAQAQAIAQVEFAEMPLDVPPAPETLPVDVLADILDKLPILEAWARDVRAHAQGLAERGQPVPGQKLVAKRATRKWSSEEQTRRWLEGKGYDPEEIEERKLKSPAQIERVMGKAKKELPAELIVKVSSGYTLVPESDPREAVQLSPGSEFPALPAGHESE